MTTELLPLVFPAIMVGLQDGVDDVCSVAAAALIPVTDTLVTVLPNEVGGHFHTDTFCKGSVC